MFLDAIFRAIKEKNEECASKQIMKHFKNVGLRKVELDENMNCTLIFADRISKAKGIERFRDESPEIREKFISDFMTEFDAGCGSHEETIRDGVKVWSWILE